MNVPRSNFVLKRAFSGGWAIALLSTGSPAMGQAMQENGWIEVGLYAPSVNSRMQVGNPRTRQVGTNLDLEDDLKLSKNEVLPSISAGVRISNSFTAIADIYELNRKRSTIIEDSIEFDGATYPVTAKVATRFDSRIYRLALGYSVLRDRDTELSVALGAHVTDFQVRLDGEFTSTTGSAEIVARRRKVLAPLPTFGLSAAHEIAPRVTVAARADALSLKVGDYKGRLINAQAAAAYRLGNSWKLGAMYRLVDYRLDVDKADWSGRIKYRFQGPAIFVQWGW